MGKKLKFSNEWIVGEQIGRGGFGRVFEATSADGQRAAVKFVPKARGADRELLFVDLKDVRNVVPIIDSGEVEDSWVLVMPRADMSLRQHLDQIEGPLDSSELIDIVSDVVAALADLDGKVVHRDLKPDNILLLEGKWCLADFGISRYAESTTSPDTQKFAMTPAYAAPERWRSERATTATDVYALGVLAFEMASGALPFIGPKIEDFRHQHLFVDPPDLPGLGNAMSALITECLYKAPEARPPPANIEARLPQIKAGPSSSGLENLKAANLAEVRRKGELTRKAFERQSALERREELFKAASDSLDAVSNALLAAITSAAPSAVMTKAFETLWRVTLNGAVLEFGKLAPVTVDPWQGWAPAFDVIAQSYVGIKIPPDRYGYEGRSHSLWYCDAQTDGYYQWFETAFMISPMVDLSTKMRPFSLPPQEESAKALRVGVSEFQMAWPFTPIDHSTLEDFIDRWAEWFAAAAEGNLHSPGTMPERNARGSWRSK